VGKVDGVLRLEEEKGKRQMETLAPKSGASGTIDWIRNSGIITDSFWPLSRTLW